jgi:hypothetical protein
MGERGKWGKGTHHMWIFTNTTPSKALVEAFMGRRVDQGGWLRRGVCWHSLNVIITFILQAFSIPCQELTQLSSSLIVPCGPFLWGQIQNTIEKITKIGATLHCPWDLEPTCPMEMQGLLYFLTVLLCEFKNIAMVEEDPWYDFYFYFLFWVGVMPKEREVPKVSAHST